MCVRRAQLHLSSGALKEAQRASSLPKFNPQTKQKTNQCQRGLQGLFPSLGHLHGGPGWPGYKSQRT